MIKKIRKSNIDEIEFNNENFIVAKYGERIPFIEANIRNKKVKDSKRYQTLFKYGINLLLLNPDITIEEMVEDVFNQNKLKCINPLPKHSIEKLVEVIFNKKRNEEIFNTNKGNIVKFNPKSKMSKNQKLAEVVKIVGERRTKVVIEKIINCLENWDFEVEGKITAKKISKLSNVGERTVRKYYSIFNIKEMNKTKNVHDCCYKNDSIGGACFFIKNKNKEKNIDQFIFRGPSEILPDNNLEKNTSTLENEIIGPITVDENGNVITLNNTTSTINEVSSIDEERIQRTEVFSDSNYDLKTIQGITDYLKDNNIQLHRSIKVTDFLKNLDYINGTDQDRIKFLR